MDDKIKKTSILPVTEENWMSYHQSLHYSNEPLSPNQEMITSQLRNLEQLTLQTHTFDYFINEIEIRIAVKKLKNNTYSFSDKIKNEMNKSARRK